MKFISKIIVNLLVIATSSTLLPSIYNQEPLYSNRDFILHMVS